MNKKVEKLILELVVALLRDDLTESDKSEIISRAKAVINET